MIEYRTRPLPPETLLQELSFYCDVLARHGIETTHVMFGWDSHLDMDDMWQEIPVAQDRLVDFVAATERAGTVTVGKSDIFVEAGRFDLTLCHEGDIHLKAPQHAADEFFRRWEDKGYAPYAVQPDLGNAQG